MMGKPEAMVFGSLGADSPALGAPWVYDAKRIARLLTQLKTAGG